MTTTKSTPSAAATSAKRHWKVGLAASLLLTASPVALRAETSNAELAKQINELKAQIRSLKGSVAETRRTKRTTTVVAAPAPAPAYNIPAGAVPVFATADKKMVFGNLTITPGGYVEADGIFRTRSTQADVNTPFNAIPTLNNDTAHNTENRYSIR